MLKCGITGSTGVLGKKVIQNLPFQFHQFKKDITKPDEVQNWVNKNNFDLFIHKSIQEVNFYIFLFGLFGYYFLLRSMNFTLNVIFPTLLFINFFLPSISMRLVYKPEILAFALLPWVIYLLEQYLKSKNTVNLILSIPMLVSIITIKGNVLVIVSIYLFLSYFKIFLNIPKIKLFIFF